MPGSVIAMAVMSSPDDDAGQPARALLVGGEREEVGEADVGVQRDAEAGGADARVLQLLADHLVVAEVVDAAAAVLLGHGHAEEPRGARRWRTARAARCPASFHSRWWGVDLPLDERPEALAEQVVILGELRAAHADEVTDVGRSVRAREDSNLRPSD